ncbi:MAG TPA: adenylate/guanylate cyclase domain-containing protein [Aestuariivirgaceae bacterium]|nr:adenylate/guanylate cyclase domain-containing protein [Aestuariivirgaceae bacterium]
MKRSRALAILIGVIIVIVLTILRWADPFIVRSVRELAFDQFQRISPRLAVEQPVRIVDIDETSLQAYGQWPWPRTRLAELVNRLVELNARAIVFDVIFAEPDRLSPAAVLNEESIRSALLQAGTLPNFSNIPDSDAIFAKAIANQPVVLGYAITSGSDAKPMHKAGIAVTGEDATLAPPRFTGVTPVLPQLQEAAAGLGSLSFEPSPTSVVRRIPLLLTDGSTLYPGLTLEALRVAQGSSTYLVANAPEVSASIANIRVGDVVIPTTGSGALWLHYAPETRGRYISVRRVLEESEAPATRRMIEGSIVLVGTSSQGLLDVRTTALGEHVPGVSIHAQAIDQILSGTFLSRPDWADGLETAGVLILGLGIVALVAFIGPVSGLFAGIAMAAASAGGSWAAFKYGHILVDPSFPVMSGLAALFAMTAFRFLVTDRERRTIRRAFSQYLAPSLLGRIEATRGALKLGGEERHVTLMFVDVRDFTTISEGLNPTELVDFLNRLLNELSRPIMTHDGTLDKFIGDSVMAFWNAPLETSDHEAKAARAALEMRAALKGLNDQDALRLGWRMGEAFKVRIGVGINTGLACVGNMGAESRFNYSAVGDVVNVASRVESAAKHVNFDILVSDSTASAVRGMALLDAGLIELKGKAARQRLHALVGDEKVSEASAFRDLVRMHESLLRSLASGEMAAAKRALGRCREKIASEGWTHLEPFYDRILERRSDYLN